MKKSRNAKRVSKRKNKVFCAHSKVKFLDEFYEMFKGVELDIVGQEYETLKDFLNKRK